jgi:hypothetical protein
LTTCSGTGGESTQYFDQNGNPISRADADAAPTSPDPFVEDSIIGLYPVHPLPAEDDKDYITIEDTRSDTTKLFNTIDRTTRTVTISGKTVVIQKGHTQKLFESFNVNNSPAQDIETMSIYAETLIIRENFKLPQTTVKIYAKEIRFEGDGCIDTTPINYSVPAAPGFKKYFDADDKEVPTPVAGGYETIIPGSNGLNGGNGGDIYLSVGSFYSDAVKTRFIMNGGDGQQAGFGHDGEDGKNGGDGTNRWMTMNPFNYNNSHGYSCSSPCPCRRHPRPTPEPFNSSNESGIVYWRFNTSNMGDFFPYIYGSRIAATSGTDAIAGGKPGSAGNAGSIHANVVISDQYFIVDYLAKSHGKAGKKPTDDNGEINTYKGGAAGIPHKAYAVDVIDSGGSGSGGSDCHGITETHSIYWASTLLGEAIAGKDGPNLPADYLVGTDSQQIVDTTLSYAWLTPRNVKAVIDHAKDLYLYGYVNRASAIFSQYITSIDNYTADPSWSSLSPDAQTDLLQYKAQMEIYSHQLASNLDFYGNPPGWVPMLSFEVTKIAFENEVERAIRTLYFTYWMNNCIVDIYDRAGALMRAHDMLIQEVATDQKEYADAAGKLPAIQIELVKQNETVTKVQNDLMAYEQHLIREATDAVTPHVPAWKKALRSVGMVASMCPMIQPYGGAVGMGLNAITNIEDKPLESLFTLGSVAANYNKNFGATKNFYTQLQTAGDGIKNYRYSPDSLTANYYPDQQCSFDFTDCPQYDINGVESALDKQRRSYYAQSNAAITGQVTEIKKNMKQYKEMYASLSAPKTNIDQLLEQSFASIDQLESQLPANVKAKLKEYQGKDGDFQTKKRLVKEALKNLADIQSKMNAIATTVTEKPIAIQSKLLALSSYTQDLAGINKIVSERSATYIADMDKRARERLQKYHYYLAKAYQYRLLKPYPGELNLDRLFNQMKAIATANNGSADLSASDFQALKTIYTEQLATITGEIYDQYIQNRSELSTPVSFSLPQALVDKLNAGEAVTINLHDIGLFMPEEENLRICDFKVKELKYHTTGTIGSFGYITVQMGHSGMSRINKGGENYLFRHYNSNTTNPITWGARCDLYDGSIYPIKPSAASESLLRSLLRSDIAQSDDNIMLYSRPAAWADIVITKSDKVQSGAKGVIDSIRFELQYDYTPKPTEFVALEVAAPNDYISPEITVGTPDANGRTDGMGFFTRNFSKATTDSITLTAPAKVGYWVFSRWSDGTSIPAAASNANAGMFSSRSMSSSIANPYQPTVTVSLADHVSLKPIYTYSGPNPPVEPTTPGTVTPTNPGNGYTVDRGDNNTSNDGGGYMGCGSGAFASDHGKNRANALAGLISLIGFMLIPFAVLIARRQLLKKN